MDPACASNICYCLVFMGNELRIPPSKKRQFEEKTRKPPFAYLILPQNLTEAISLAQTTLYSDMWEEWVFSGIFIGKLLNFNLPCRKFSCLLVGFSVIKSRRLGITMRNRFHFQTQYSHRSKRPFCYSPSEKLSIHNFYVGHLLLSSKQTSFIIGVIKGQSRRRRQCGIHGGTKYEVLEEREG